MDVFCQPGSFQRNNIFVNIKREPTFAFGKSAAVFIPDPVNNIRICNNIFDRIGGNPGFQMKGLRWDDYYKPRSVRSLVVDKGNDIGQPYAGHAPDTGRWEYK